MREFYLLLVQRLITECRVEEKIPLLYQTKPKQTKTNQTTTTTTTTKRKKKEINPTNANKKKKTTFQLMARK